MKHNFLKNRIKSYFKTNSLDFITLDLLDTLYYSYITEIKICRTLKEGPAGSYLSRNASDAIPFHVVPIKLCAVGALIMSNILLIARILTAALYFSMGLQQLNQCISGKMLFPKMNKVCSHLLVLERCVLRSPTINFAVALSVTNSLSVALLFSEANWFLSQTQNFI